MPEMTNEQRAVVAAQAVEAYRVAGEYSDQHPAELLGDLLGDLRHWAAKVGVDFEQCDRNALACFEAEVKEEADNAG
jgi:hypothetical protein